MAHPQFLGRPYGDVDFAERYLLGVDGRPDAYREAVGIERRHGFAALVDERLIAGPWSKYYRSVGTDEILERFHHALPEARVLVTVRRQQNLLRSQYLQAVTTGYPFLWSHFLTEQIEAMDGGWVGTVDFMPVVERLHALFGPQQVRVAVFEDLVRRPDAFWRGLSEWTGDPFYATTSTLPHRNATRRVASRLDVMLNRRLLRSRYRPTGRVVSRASYSRIAARMPQLGREIEFEAPRAAALMSTILSRAAAGNREVARLTGVDLEKLGYCVG
ncbi:MAG TPA: hypothetical protein VMZ22_09465 [Acidimicrobiales bacterium]|nr:hypothetical protein [Acidimicrobiales bacterium]